MTMTIVWPYSRHRGAQEVEHLGAGAGVQVAGRLVGEDHLGAGDQRPGARHPLLLATGELRRPVVQPVPRPTVAITVSYQAGSGLRPAIDSGSRTFSSAVSVGSRLNCWKMKPTLSRRSFVSPASPSPVTWCRRSTPPAGHRVQPGQAVHQRRLARARRTHDRRVPAALELGGDAPQGDDLRLAAAVHLPHVARPGRGLCLRSYRRRHFFSLSVRLIRAAPAGPARQSHHRRIPAPLRPTPGGVEADFAVRVAPIATQG